MGLVKNAAIMHLSFSDALVTDLWWVSFTDRSLDTNTEQTYKRPTHRTT